MFFKPFVATLLSASAVLAANPDKPAVNPPVPYWGVHDGLMEVMTAPKWSQDYWLPNGMPQSCKEIAQSKGLNPSDFKIFNAKYSDCDMKWVMCRHKNAGATERDMIDKLGRIPVKMRSYVRHFIATPGLGDGAAAWAYSTGDILVESNPTLWTLFHEFSHSLDWHGLPQHGTFSKSSIWQDSYAKDANTVTEYGRTNWAENFAESGVVASYNHNVERGIGKIMSNWRSIRYQKETFENYFASFITPGGTCGTRFPNSPKVPMSGSAKMAAAEIKEDEDTKVNWDGIEKLIPRPEIEGEVRKD